MVTSLNEQLRRDEGEVLSAYPDSLGYLTIGVGRLIDKRRNGGITPEESAYLLNNDIQRKTAEVFKALPWVKDLDQIRLNVLINMAFMGIGTLLKFENTLAAMRDGRYDLAAAGMLNSKWAKQVGARAQRLAAIMRTGQFPN